MEFNMFERLVESWEAGGRLFWRMRAWVPDALYYLQQAVAGLLSKVRARVWISSIIFKN